MNKNKEIQQEETVITINVNGLNSLSERRNSTRSPRSIFFILRLLSQYSLCSQNPCGYKTIVEMLLLCPFWFTLRGKEPLTLCQKSQQSFHGISFLFSYSDHAINPEVISITRRLWLARPLSQVQILLPQIQGGISITRTTQDQSGGGR